MKITFHLFFLLLFSYNFALGQDVSIDLLLNTNKDNSEFQLEKIVNEVLAEQADGCISFNVITERSAGTSPYIIELWESDEFINQYIFKANRIRKVEGTDGNTIEKKYTAAGINVRALYKVLGRMTERESHSIIDVFILDGRIDKEINEEEVRKQWNADANERKELSDYILNEHKDEILQKRYETQSDIKQLLAGQLLSMVITSILPPTKITGIAEQKSDKVKKVKIEKCPEIDISQYGTFYFAIYTLDVKGGKNIYTQVGTCYFDKNPDVMEIKNGEKELLPLLKNGTPLYIGKHKSMDSHAISSEKIQPTKDLSFVFFYQPTNTYTELERLNLEFIYQASFLGYKNIRVIADEKLTESINKTTAQSIYTYDPEKEDDFSITIDDIKSNTTIFVGVSNPKKLNLKSGLFKNDDTDPDAEYIITQTEYKKGDEAYKSMTQFETFRNKLGLYNTSLTVSIPEIKAALIDESLTLIGIAEEKKEKVKKVYVSSMVPLDEGDSYNVYLKEGFTKKTKEFAELKIDELVNKYVAIAEVKKGDKEIGPYADGNKPVFTSKSGESGGLFGKAMRFAGAPSGYVGTLSYILGSSSKL